MSDDSLLPIDKGIPISVHGGSRPPKYPWAMMEVGDSFFIPCSDAERQAARNRLSGAISFQKATQKTRFVTRTVDGGIRVWRVE